MSRTDTAVRVISASPDRIFAALTEYLFGAGERGDHVDPHVVAGANVLLGDSRGRGWLADMRFCTGLRPGVSRPVWHCSLRAAPQDPVLDDARWATIAGQFVAALGLARHPWVAVRHGRAHVHILAGRVNAHGGVWRDSNDYRWAMAAVRAIERDHGLVTVDSPGRYVGTAGDRAQSRA